MNSAVKNLEEDHDHILVLLDVMDRMTAADKPDVDDLEKVVYLIRSFADGFHHAKEENVLFPALALKGMSPYHGPVAVMLGEHAQGRSYVAGMASNIDLLKTGDNAALEKIYSNMKDYTALLRNHIAKENNVLFRMAENLLTPEEHSMLLEKYAEATADRPVSGICLDAGKEISVLNEKY